MAPNDKFYITNSVVIIVIIISIISITIDGFNLPRIGQKVPVSHSNLETQKHASILQFLKNKISNIPEVPVEIKTESQIMLEFLQDKPWRAPKVKNLKIVYRPWRDSWKERYRDEDDETIYQYSLMRY
jgi:hypothetical protein